MNGNSPKVSHLVTILSLLLVLAILLISFGTSMAAATQKPQSGQSLAASFQQDDPPRADPVLLRRLKANARGSVTINAKKSTGFVGFARVSKGGDLLPAAGDADLKRKPVTS